MRAPRGADDRVVMDVLRKKEPWLLRKIEELSPATPRRAQGWHHGMELPLLGRLRPVQVVSGGRRGVTLTPAGFVVSSATSESGELHRIVSRWYHRRAVTVFSHRMNVVRRDRRIAALGDPGALKVRRMRRRWGSCFLDGRINLNTELLGEPIALIDYVIIHELCHLREHNHSPRFYRLMDEALPDWREYRIQLHRSTTAGFLYTP